MSENHLSSPPARPEQKWSFGKSMQLLVMASIVAPLALGLVLASGISIVMLCIAVYENDYDLYKIIGYFAFVPFVLMIGFFPGFANGLVLGLVRSFAGPFSLARYSLIVTITSLVTMWLMMGYLTDGKDMGAILWGGVAWSVLCVATCLAFWRLRRRLGLGALSA